MSGAHRQVESVRLDNIEALANAGIGLVISWMATLALLPLWGLTPNAGQSAGITVMFFCLSFTRARAIRWVFRRLADV